MKVVTLFSGGLDSTALLHALRSYGELPMSDPGAEITAVSFDYGQKHRKELEAAVEIAQGADVPHYVIRLQAEGPTAEGIPLGPLSRVLGGSALVSDHEVPDGHYAEDVMKQTVVPNRNAIMLSVAYGIAVAQNADYVTFAAHAGDHTIYPDCRPIFVEAMNSALMIGNRWKPSEHVPEVVAPFVHMDKSDIAKLASRVMDSADIAKTWSCYKGGKIHCGTCGTCYERREAFEKAGLFDPTEYLDNTTKFAAPV